MESTFEKAKKIILDALPNGGRIGIGVSGGADSVVLLDITDIISKSFPIKPVVLHFDHNVRQDSHLDAEFVKNIAESRKLEYYIEKFSPQPESSEEELRKARYDFFHNSAAALNLTAIMTAHNANDQAETVLFRILRGTGIKGLAGIPRKRDAGEFIFLRPLIDVRREDILRYIKSKGLMYREDSTNTSDKYFRNRIRNQILPFLIEYSQSDVIDNLCFLANISSEDEIFFEEIIRQELNLYSIEKNLFSIPAAILKDMKPSIRKRFLHNLLLRFGIYPDRTQIIGIEEIIFLSGRLNLKNDLNVWLDEKENKFFIGKFPERIKLSEEYEVLLSGKTIIEMLALEINVSKKIHRPDILELKIRRPKPESLFKPWNASAFINADAIRGKLKIRLWQAGDRIVPFGMTGSKKLQDLFTDEKISPFERDRWPILCDDEEILWIIGLKQSEKTRINESTRETLYVEVKSSGIENEENNIA